jgi:signal transduction histidine kinase
MFGAWSSVAVVADPAGELLKLSQVRGKSDATPPAVECVPLDTPLPLADAIRQQKLLWIESRAACLARYPQLSQHVSGDDDFALICVPFVLDDRALGSLALQIVPPRPASVAEVAFLEAVAYQCAQALDRTLLYDAIRASRQQLMELSVRLVNAQEDQRRTLAYELHDEIGQQLTGLNMVLENGRRLTAAQLSAQLSEAQRLVADLIGQVRQLSLDLRPPMLDDMGLLATLLWHIQRYTQQTNIVVDFKYHELDAQLPPHVAITAYRIVQEGLTNIARHAQTATAVVRVWVSAGQLKISIEDQGCGFDVAATPLVGQSLGLAGMHERTQLLGGQLSLDSRPGEGTHIRVTLPIDTAKGL